MLGQSSLQVKTLSKQLASLDQPSIVDKIIELLKTPEVSKLFSAFSPFLSMFVPGEEKRNTEESNKPNSGEGDWL
jgi:hypothetical protein